MVIGFDASRVFEKTRTGTEEYSYQLLKNLAKIDQENYYIVYCRSLSKHDAIVHYFDKLPKNFKFKEIKWSRLWTQGGLAV